MVLKSARSILLLACMATPAVAHSGFQGHGDFVGGFVHPLSGWDHCLAMVALGLWLGLTQPRMPAAAFATFSGALTAGFLLAVNGLHVPFVEPGILTSVFVFGLLTVAAVRLPDTATAPLIAAFIVFHGHAHGTEAPEGAAVAYAAGFIGASVLIVAAAYAGALSVRNPKLIRPVGAAIVAAGTILGFTA
jgi:urease accessory protein